MTAITSVTALSNATAASGTVTTTGRGYNDLGQADFFRLLTVQIQQQDPLDPVDNKEMLAQMAQFTSLSGINDVNSTLQEINAKLDQMAAGGTSLAAKTATHSGSAAATILNTES